MYLTHKCERSIWMESSRNPVKDRTVVACRGKWCLDWRLPSVEEWNDGPETAAVCDLVVRKVHDESLSRYLRALWRVAMKAGNGPRQTFYFIASMAASKIHVITNDSLVPYSLSQSQAWTEAWRQGRPLSSVITSRKDRATWHSPIEGVVDINTREDTILLYDTTTVSFLHKGRSVGLFQELPPYNDDCISLRSSSSRHRHP